LISRTNRRAGAHRCRRQKVVGLELPGRFLPHCPSPPSPLAKHQDDAHAALFAPLEFIQHASHRFEVKHPRLNSSAPMATATQRAEDADKSAGMGEVTLGQKMLSAVSGSILTSLLGAYTQVHIMLEQNDTPSSLVARSHSRNTMLSPCNNTIY
jgi:hypothetical protein